MRCTINDIDRVNNIMTDLEVWEGIIDDGCSLDARHNSAEIMLSSEGVYVLSPNEYSVFFLVPHNSFTYEIHTNIKKEGRGPEAFAAGRAIVEFMFKQTHCLKLMSWIPEFNRKTLAFALRCGLKKEGILVKSFLRDGNLYDETLVGITKEAWLCQ